MIVGVTLAAIANLQAGARALELQGDPLMRFLQDKVCRNTTPPRASAAQVLAWLDRRKLLSCLIAPQHPAVNDWLDLNGFPTVHIPDYSNAVDVSRMTRTRIWVVHHTDDLSPLQGTFIHMEGQEGTINVQGWAELQNMLSALPLDYRQKREKHF